MDISERLDLLADQAKTWYQVLADYVFRHTAIQIILLGWAITSESARDRIDALGPGLQGLIAVLPLAYSAMVIVIFREVKLKSDRTMTTVRELDEVVADDLENYVILRRFWIGMGAVHASLSVVIVVLLFA